MKIYILTHKKFDYEEEDIYEPLLNGSASLNEDFGYTRDDSGDNISELNAYYAELTGQYWVWKNSNEDIIGFCHYRRFLAKNVLLNKKLGKEEIEEILTEYDIIMPKKNNLTVTNIENIAKSYRDGYGVNPKEYDKLRKVIKEFYPDYLDTFDEVVNSKWCWWYNMFICKKELADEYFTWLFDILKKMENEVNFDEYEDKRVPAFLAERLLTVFIRKNNLKVKEKHIIFTESKMPHVSIMGFRFPFLVDISVFLNKRLQ
jgi:hypothetical protein